MLCQLVHGIALLGSSNKLGVDAVSAVSMSAADMHLFLWPVLHWLSVLGLNVMDQELGMNKQLTDDLFRHTMQA